MKLRLFPRIKVSEELPQWITSTDKAAYIPRFNREFPMTIWFSRSVMGGKRDWFWTVIHEFGHFFVDWGTVFHDSYATRRIQDKYDAWWINLVDCKFPLWLLGDPRKM